MSGDQKSGKGNSDLGMIVGVAAGIGAAAALGTGLLGTMGLGIAGGYIGKNYLPLKTYYK